MTTANLLYVHGFLSSPASYKAQQTKAWLAQHHPEIHFYCPPLTPYPNECAQALSDIIRQAQQAGRPIYLMGSSLGGYWATWCAETFDLKAVLINPAVNVLELLPHYIDTPLKNYHNNEQYRLNTDHIHQIQAYDVPPKRLGNYWVLLQTGDETLDYRLAIAKYTGCRQTVEPGGDHSFQGFERHLAQALTFFESKTPLV